MFGNFVHSPWKPSCEISDVPLSANCSFTRDLCGWKNDHSSDSQFSWTRSSGTTASTFTGPPGDREGILRRFSFNQQFRQWSLVTRSWNSFPVFSDNRALVQWTDVCSTQRTEDNRCCVFPFVFNGASFNSCTTVNASRKWCASTANYDRDKQWGFCDGMTYDTIFRSVQHSNL